MVHCTRVVTARRKVARTTNTSAFNGGKPDEWDQLLEGKPYWNVLRITAWAIRFKDNTLAKKQMTKKRKGALCTDEIRQAKELWVRRAQKRIPQDTETPGWRLVGDKETAYLSALEGFLVTDQLTSKIVY